MQGSTTDLFVQTNTLSKSGIDSSYIHNPTKSKIKTAESLLFSYVVFLKSNDHAVSNLKHYIAEVIRIENTVGRNINLEHMNGNFQVNNI